jgi:hypothetical protein
MSKKYSIEDLLNSLEDPTTDGKKVLIKNTKETWERIGSRDSFPELNLSESELDEFLSEWVKENPYQNI